jgi:hypothetical protein
VRGQLWSRARRHYDCEPKNTLTLVHCVKMVQLLANKCARSLTRLRDEEESNEMHDNVS